MNINMSSFSSYAVSLFKQSVLPSLTSQQKKIILIASLAFGLLAVWYAACRCRCFKATKIESEDKPEVKPDRELNHFVDEPLNNDGIEGRRKDR